MMDVKSDHDGALPPFLRAVQRGAAVMLTGITKVGTPLHRGAGGPAEGAVGTKVAYKEMVQLSLKQMRYLRSDSMSHQADLRTESRSIL